jgi:hypothetical protein
MLCRLGTFCENKVDLDFSHRLRIFEEKYHREDDYDSCLQWLQEKFDISAIDVERLEEKFSSCKSL